MPLSASEWGGFDEGFAAAAKNGKSVIVDFSADWCIWCKKMDKDVFSRADVRGRLSREFNTVRLDTDSNTPLTYKGKKLTSNSFAKYMRVQGLPTLIVFDPSGNPLSELPGYVDAKTFNSYLDYVGKKMYGKMTFEQYLKTGGVKK
jgi:thioredoxin-related protein